MMRMLFVTLIAAIAVTTIPVAADPPPQRPRYVVILRNPRVLLAQPNASAAARFTDPDFPALGGSLVEKWGRYRVIDIAAEAIAALLRHPSVESIQRVFTGGPLPVPVIPAASSLHASSEGLHARSDASWDSGTYAYDGAGNIKTIGSKSYTYDSAGRLAQYADSGTEIENYEYDSFGNLVKKVTAGLALSIPTDTGSNRLQGVEYDLNGNVKVNGIDRYESDPLNMMQRRNSSSLEQFYFYTADDERIAVYDNEWRFTVRDFAGHPMREWVAGSMTATATWSWVEDHIYRDGQLLAADRDAGQGGTRHFHLDHLGTPRLITTQSGSGSSVFGYKLAQHDYYPFGVEQTSTIQETTSFGYDRSEPQQFTGHERDSGGGGVLAAGNADYLDYMHARYYSPGLGRFLSVDPAQASHKSERPQTWNRYSYARNNPIVRFDPDGLVDKRSDEDRAITESSAVLGASARAVHSFGPQTQYEYGAFIFRDCGSGAVMSSDVVTSQLPDRLEAQPATGTSFELLRTLHTHVPLGTYSTTVPVKDAGGKVVNVPAQWTATSPGTASAGDVKYAKEVSNVPGYVITPSAQTVVAYDATGKQDTILSGKDYEEWMQRAETVKDLQDAAAQH